MSAVPVGVLLLGFGGPEKPEDIRPFLRNVLRGRPVPEARFEEVAHHYEVIGGRSPINELTEAQRDALQAELERRGHRIPVRVGMRNWTPTIPEGAAELARLGAARIVGLVLAAHRTESSHQRYEAEAREAVAALDGTHELRFTQSFHASRGFVEANATHVRDAFQRLPPALQGEAKLIFTAHSIPSAAAQTSPYVAQRRESCEAIATAAGVAQPGLAYQSRSGPPQQPWLEPDINQVLRDEAAAGTRAVVLCPAGFVCDHVEVLYDLDVEARQTAEKLGIALERAQAANAHPAFVRSLADLVLRTG